MDNKQPPKESLKILFARIQQPPKNPNQDEKAVSIQYKCIILQHPKKMGEAGCQCSADTQIRPRRAEIT
jgi:hypothetical protein